MLEFGSNVKAADVVEGIQIRTITEITRYTNKMKNVNANIEIDCEICHAKFDNFEEFIVHKNLIHKIKPYVCNVCGAKFCLSAHLSIHDCDKHKKNPSTSFEELPTTSKGSLSINSSRNYKNCTTSSELAINSKTSMQQNEQSNLTQNICVTTPDTILQKTKLEPFKCVNCVFATGSETEFINHLDICKNISKTSSELHQCNLCTKSFKSKAALNGHMKCHPNKRKISRRQPSSDKKKVENQNENVSIVKSQNIVSNIENRSQKGKNCDKYLTTRSKLNIDSKQQKQKLICNVCQQNYLSKKSLENHLLSHINIKTSNGKTKIIKNTDDKIEKQNISHNNKLFQCSNCNTNCESKRSLGQHKRQHHSRLEIPKPIPKSKTVKCDWCSIIITKCNLLRHIKSLHPNINPIQCEYCPTRFKDSRSLKLHKSKLHNVKVV